MTLTEEKVTKLGKQIMSKDENMFLKSNRISDLESESKAHRQEMLLKSNRISELERELATHRQDMLLEKGNQLKLQHDLSQREKDIRELRQENRLAAERMRRDRSLALRMINPDCSIRRPSPRVSLTILVFLKKNEVRRKKSDNSPTKLIE